jgi:hypothetical protein
MLNNKIISNIDNRINIIIKIRNRIMKVMMILKMMILEMLMNKILIQLIIEANLLTKWIADQLIISISLNLMNRKTIKIKDIEHKVQEEPSLKNQVEICKIISLLHNLIYRIRIILEIQINISSKAVETIIYKMLMEFEVLQVINNLI